MITQDINIDDFINHCYGLLEQGNDDNVKHIIERNIQQNQDFLIFLKNYAYQHMQNENYVSLSKIASILLAFDNESASHWQYYAIATHSLNDQYSDNFQYFDLAIHYADDPFHAQSNKARAMSESGLISQAKALYEELLDNYRHDPARYYNIKSSLIILLAHHYPSLEDEILPMAAEFLKKDAENINITIITAHIYLRKGNFAQAKPLYQQRFKAENFKQWNRPPLHIPQWQGHIEAGKSLYIWAEQGLGDEIKFLTLIEKLLDGNMRLIIDCDQRILPMMQQRYPQITFYPRLKQQHHALDFDNIDYHAPMAQLFLESCADISDLPGITQPLLTPSHRLITKWQKQLAQYVNTDDEKPILIGISWYSIFGAPFDHKGKKRSDEITDHFRRNHNLIDFAMMIQQAVMQNNPNQDIILVNLQYEYKQKEINHYNQHQQNSKEKLPILLNFHDLNPTYDLEDVCAILYHCDYVVTIGNALAHLAGAMIKKTFTIIPENAAWHYSNHPKYHDYMAFYGRHHLVFFQNTHENQQQYRQRLTAPLSQFLSKQ